MRDHFIQTLKFQSAPRLWAAENDVSFIALLIINTFQSAPRLWAAENRSICIYYRHVLVSIRSAALGRGEQDYPVNDQYELSVSIRSAALGRGEQDYPVNDQYELSVSIRSAALGRGEP